MIASSLLLATALSGQAATSPITPVPPLEIKFSPNLPVGSTLQMDVNGSCDLVYGKPITKALSAFPGSAIFPPALHFSGFSGPTPTKFEKCLNLAGSNTIVYGFATPSHAQEGTVTVAFKISKNTKIGGYDVTMTNKSGGTWTCDPAKGGCKQ